MGKRVTKAQLQQAVATLESALIAMRDKCSMLESALRDARRMRSDPRTTARDAILCFIGRSGAFADDSELWKRVNMAIKLGERDELITVITKSDEFAEWLKESYR